MFQDKCDDEFVKEENVKPDKPDQNEIKQKIKQNINIDDKKLIIPLFPDLDNELNNEEHNNVQTYDTNTVTEQQIIKQEPDQDSDINTEPNSAWRTQVNMTEDEKFLIEDSNEAKQKNNELQSSEINTG